MQLSQLYLDSRAPHFDVDGMPLEANGEPRAKSAKQMRDERKAGIAEEARVAEEVRIAEELEATEEVRVGTLLNTLGDRVLTEQEVVVAVVKFMLTSI